ncbi:MAG: hypothetical protein HC837_11290 [Chloroflexaceae bacterium]|nr:hypothetical protein [Chloroflexaceae bacterium]
MTIPALSNATFLSYATPNVVEARLHILARQGRNEEFLELAQKTGSTMRYATMLIQIGRVAKAVEVGIQAIKNEFSTYIYGL